MGTPLDSVANLLKRFQGESEEVAAEAFMDLQRAIESAIQERLDQFDYRLYLMSATRTRSADPQVIEMGLDQLAREPDPVLRLQFAAAFIACVIQGPPDAPSSPRTAWRLAAWPLRVVAVSGLEETEFEGLISEYFRGLPKWARVGVMHDIVDGLARYLDSYLPIAILFTPVLNQMQLDEQVFFYPRFIDGLTASGEVEFMGVPKTVLIDGAISSVLVSIQDGAGDEETVNSVSRLLLLWLRELPLRSRIELAQEVKRILIARGATLEAVSSVAYQVADWTSALSSRKALAEIDSLRALALSMGERLPKDVEARTLLLSGRLMLRVGEKSRAAALAREAIALVQPEDTPVHKSALAIIAAAGAETATERAELSHADWLGLRLMEAESQLEDGDPQKALRTIQYALNTAQADQGSHPLITTRRLKLLRASALLMEGHGIEALSELLGVVEGLVDQVSSHPVGTNEITRRGWLAESEALVDRAVQVAALVVRDNGPIDHVHFERLWRVVSCLRDVDITFHEAIRDAWRNGETSAELYRCAHDAMATLSLHTPETIGEHLDQYGDIYTKCARACHQTEISRSASHDFGVRLRQRLGLNSEDVRSQLLRNEVLVEFASFWTGATDERGVGLRSLIAFVLDAARGLESFFIAGPAVNEIAEVSKVVRDLDHDPALHIDAPLDVGTMGKTLIHISKQYGANSLLIIPDGPLREVGFASLPTERGYLGDDITVSLVGNTGDLFRAGGNKPQGPPVVLGCGDFDEAIADIRAPFKELWGAEPEAKAVGSILGVRPVLGGEVTVKTLDQLAGPRLLHVATHGYYEEAIDARVVEALLPQDRSEWAIEQLTTNRLSGSRSLELPLNSGLALASANAWLVSASDQLGVATAYRVSWLDLVGTETVTFSGCVTGRGPSERWRGLVDLRRAALLAGARQAIVSVRPVPDFATTILMCLVYSDSDELGARSLSKAQRRLRMMTVAELKTWVEDLDLRFEGLGQRYLSEVLRMSPSARPFAHERFWGGFVCYTTRSHPSR